MDLPHLTAKMLECFAPRREHIRSLGLTGERTLAVLDEIASATTPKFFLPSRGPIDEQVTLRGLVSVAPPFPSSVVEHRFAGPGFFTSCVILASPVTYSEAEGVERSCITLAMVGFSPEAKRWIMPPVVCNASLHPAPGLSGLSLYFDEGRRRTYPHLRDDLFIGFKPFAGTIEQGLLVESAAHLFESLVTILSMFEILQCSNVSTEVIHPPEALNKKRVARGKPPFDSYHVLVLPSGSSSAGAPQGGSHASPRQHVRRGHIRRLASGATTWVNSCIVGRAENGIITKDYAIK